MNDPQIYQRLEALERWRDAMASLEVNREDARSWTPVLTPAGGGSYTLSTAVGRYWIVGPIVFINGRIIISGTSAPSGALSITGLPKTSVNIFQARYGVTIPDYDSINLSAGYTTLTGVIAENTTAIVLEEVGDSINAAALQAAAVGVNTSLLFSGWYVYQ